MKPEGCSILFVNQEDQVLLFLRDDIPRIPYPNTWDLLGGHVEEGESPEECIVREMQEELIKDGEGLDITGFQLFTVTEFPDRTEYTYWLRANFDIGDVELTEGQRLQWFTREETRNTELAFGFNSVVEEFFQKAPFAEA
ncbi:MAG: NUDIX domain-containing protein [Dehalococcoidia bacterium]